MKILSDSAITKDDLLKTAADLDEKQSRQIMQLRIAVAVSFVLNLAVVVGLKLFA